MMIRRLMSTQSHTIVQGFACYKSLQLYCLDAILRAVMLCCGILRNIYNVRSTTNNEHVFETFMFDQLNKYILLLISFGDMCTFNSMHLFSTRAGSTHHSNDIGTLYSKEGILCSSYIVLFCFVISM